MLPMLKAAKNTWLQKVLVYKATVYYTKSDKDANK
jgi:hypothetical protein